MLPRLTLIALATAVVFSSDRADAQRATPPSPGAARAAAETAMARGDFLAAANQWQAAIRLYSGDASSEHAHALIRLGETQQALGAYQDAAGTLDRARAMAERVNDAAMRVAAQGALGNIQSTLGRVGTDGEQRAALSADATRNLTDALRAAERSDHVAVAASIAVNLGNHHAGSGTVDEALAAFATAARLAERGDAPAIAARALTNRARVAHQAGRMAEAESALDAAYRLASALPASHDKAVTLTSVGELYGALADTGARAAALQATSERVLRQAIDAAEQVDDVLAESYARGFIGRLYEHGKNFDASLDETRRALFAGMQAQARLGGAAGDALHRWHHQAARIHAASLRIDDAIASARQAVEVLQAIRFEVTTAYGATQASFRDTVEPVFHLLVRLLLDRSRQEAARGDQARRAQLILEARGHVESLKAAELRDYFQDDCIDLLLATEREAGAVDPHAAVIYPVLLDDRTEVLASLPGGRFEQIVAPVSRSEITATVNRFRRCLADPTCFAFDDGERLYNWLIKPLEPHLQSSGVRTLVFAPDGALRTIPMAALLDGETYLIERYAIATIPAMNLVDPQPLPSTAGLRVLRTGLSEPVNGTAPLPQVRFELDGIGKLFPDGDLLLNADFTPERVNELLARNSYSIVHVASHGEFRNESSDGYLQTSSRRLLMNDLATSIGALRFRGLSTTATGPATTALELIVLSACETAEGDERAALGLAGLAIKAGARSALGTLWSVNDEAAGDLVVEFYRQLKTESGVSKAEALRRAQRRMLEGRFAHPQYWSAFLLISNWL